MSACCGGRGIGDCLGELLHSGVLCVHSDLGRWTVVSCWLSSTTPRHLSLCQSPLISPWTSSFSPDFGRREANFTYTTRRLGAYTTRRLGTYTTRRLGAYTTGEMRKVFERDWGQKDLRMQKTRNSD